MSIFNVSSKINNTAVLVSSLSQVKMYITIVKDKVDVNMHDAGRMVFEEEFIKALH